MAIHHLKKAVPSSEMLCILNYLRNIFNKIIHVVLNVTSFRLVNKGRREGS